MQDFCKIGWDLYSGVSFHMAIKDIFSSFPFFFLPETFNLSYPLASAYMNWWLNKLRISILFCSSKTCIYCCDLSDNLHKVLVSTAEIIKSSENEMFNCFHSSRQFFHIDMQELHRPQLVFWMKNASLMLILRKSLYCIPI